MGKRFGTLFGLTSLLTTQSPAARIGLVPVLERGSSGSWAVRLTAQEEGKGLG